MDPVAGVFFGFCCYCKDGPKLWAGRCIKCRHDICDSCMTSPSGQPPFKYTEILLGTSGFVAHLNLQSHSTPFIRAGRKMDMLIIINTVHSSAIPDTESLWNAMDAITAKKFGLTITNDTLGCREFEIGNGRKIVSIGRVNVDFSFANEGMEALKTSFYVFSKITTSVAIILGRQLLDATKTLTKHTYRLRERIDISQPIPSFNTLGISRRRFLCYLDSLRVQASADTGSDINIISPAYAVERGFHLEQLDESDPEYVEFPGGSLMSLSGKILAKFNTIAKPAGLASSFNPRVQTQRGAVDTSANNSKASRTTWQDDAQCFYVLWGLPVAVVLGQELLDSIAAFTHHQKAFIEIPEQDGHPEIKTIQTVNRISKLIKNFQKGKEGVDQVAATTRELLENDAAEMHRRGIVAKEISRLEKLESSTLDLTVKHIHKQQREELVARNTSQVCLYNTERQKAEDKIAQLRAATPVT